MIRKAKTNYGEYVQFKSNGRVVGWINPNALGEAKAEYGFTIPLNNANQIDTIGYYYAGCAATSMYNVLSSKGYLNSNQNLKWFYNELPLHDWDTDKGQVGAPDNYPVFKAVISPVGATNWMKHITKGDKNKIKNITGSSVGTIVSQVKKGNPVLFWGKAGTIYRGAPKSETTHVMIFMGYRVFRTSNGRRIEALQVQDPAYGTYSNKGRRWFAIHQKDRQVFNSTFVPFVEWYGIYPNNFVEQRPAIETYLNDKGRKLVVVE